jgi:hypothetical protein
MSRCWRISSGRRVQPSQTPSPHPSVARVCVGRVRDHEDLPAADHRREPAGVEQERPTCRPGARSRTKPRPLELSRPRSRRARGLESVSLVGGSVSGLGMGGKMTGAGCEARRPGAEIAAPGERRWREVRRAVQPPCDVKFSGWRLTMRSPPGTAGRLCARPNPSTTSDRRARRTTGGTLQKRTPCCAARR